MMWFTKLKLAAAGGMVAVAVGAASVGAGRDAVAEEPKTPAALPEYGPKYGTVVRSVVGERTQVTRSERQQLAGTWMLESTTVDGKLVPPDPTPQKLSVSFDAARTCVLRAEITSRRQKNEQSWTYDYAVNPSTPAKELFLAGDDGIHAWVYEVDADTLRTAEFEGLGVDRPRGFTPKDQPPASPPLTVKLWKRVRLMRTNPK